MTHEHDHDRTHRHDDRIQREVDPTVSRATRSSQLDAPEHPITSGLVQRKARDANGVAGDADQAVAAASSSSGSALPDTLMRKFESSLGTDLSSVRVHTGGASETATHAVGAKAYAMGQDIHFGAGQYDPGSAGGQHLIAHEVAHTVQQRGGSPTRQNQLEVSTPHDAAEHEADRAADAMITGAPAHVGGAPAVAARKDDLDAKIATSGDQAQSQAWKTALSIDTISVDTDRSRVPEIVKDIDAQSGNLIAAEKDDGDLESRFAPRATNAATKVNLSMFNDKLDVANVDTTAFASQYRWAYADYQRLKAEASAYTSLTHRADGGGATPMATVAGDYSSGQASKGLDIAASAESQRFREARKNLNSAATHMKAKMTLVRGAGTTMQGAAYRIKAAVAQAASDAATTKLNDVNKEIADVARGVSIVMKIASAVGGLAGGAGATDALATARTTAADGAGGAVIDPGNYAKSLGWSGQDVVNDPAKQSQLALMQAMGTDAASVVAGAGGGDMATSLVTAIGQHANKTKIATLQGDIAEASAQSKSFSAASDASTLAGAQATLEGEAAELQTLSQAFTQAKLEEREAGEALMTKLKSSGGAKGKSQARAVMFLTDTDRFLAQVQSAIAAGENQQKTIESAAGDRKRLRGTSAANGEVGPGETEHANQFYYRVQKIVTKGVLYGTNTTYKLDKVFVRFQDNMNSQGGKGTIEGHGGAGDDVANKVKALEMAKKEVQELQKAVQGALGLGAPGING